MISTSSSEAASLYVGNLDPRISELVLLEMFGEVGPLQRVKLLGGDKPTSSKYGFVEYADRKTAEMALLAFNGKKLYNMVKKSFFRKSGSTGLTALIRKKVRLIYFMCLSVI